MIANPGIVPAINWAVQAFTGEGAGIIIQPPALKVSELQGTYLLRFDCRAFDMDTEGLKDLFVNKVRVGLDHGEMFGATGLGFMRFNLATPRSNVARVLFDLREARAKLGITGKIRPTRGWRKLN